MNLQLMLDIVVFLALLLVFADKTNARIRAEHLRKGVLKETVGYEREDLHDTIYLKSAENTRRNLQAQTAQNCASAFQRCRNPKKSCCFGLECYCNDVNGPGCKCFPPLLMQ